MKLWFAVVLLSFSALAQAVEVRFDSVYFFQSEEQLREKQVDLEEVARFSRKMQAQVWKSLKKVKMPDSHGYLVIAVRADGQVAAWLDMQPPLHEYYEYEVLQAVRKVPAFAVADGSVVFGIKMTLDTPRIMSERFKHTARAKPEPAEWKEARKKLANPEDVEELVMAVWPE